MFAFLAGLAAGLLHVFSGPDHLAAVAPLASDRERGQWLTGLQWGIGHTIGVLLIAALLLLLKEQLPLDAISAYSERIVGVSLIRLAAGACGGPGCCRSLRCRSALAHSHRRVVLRWARFTAWPAARTCLACCRRWRSHRDCSSMLYLAGFGLGAIAGMTAFSAAGSGLSSRFATVTRAATAACLYASSAAALVVGGVWLVGQ